MASQQSQRQEEEPADRGMADQNSQASAPPQREMADQNTRLVAPPEKQTVEENNQKETETPPYPYQQQPLQEQKSSDYAPYPKFNEEELHQQQQQAQRQERWGTPAKMGAPANPEAHPDNKEAAAGKMMAKDPYVEDSTPHVSMGKLSFADVTEFSKKMEIIISHLWGHLTTGSSISDTAIGKMNAGTRHLTHGGFEGVLFASFPSDPAEKLKKTYACFLSTSTGPVAGTLFISNKRLAFCSDRPLQYTPDQPGAAQDKAPTQTEGQQAQQEFQIRYSYYKVAIPINKIRQVEPSVNQNKPQEKYVEVITEDKFEFWFMGFVNYDKGVKNLQAAVGGSLQE